MHCIHICTNSLHFTAKYGFFPELPFIITLKKLHPPPQSYVHFDHTHWIAKSCSTPCYSEHFFKNKNLINLLSLSTLVPLSLPTGTFLNTTPYAADGLPHFCKHKVYLEDSVGSPPASKTPPLITWTWENNAVIYLLLCTSCTCPWFPAGRRGEEEREEMLKYRLGSKTQMAALLPHTPQVPRGTGFVLGRKR